ncbi:MAG: hypothetical protein HZB16_15115 [Armatimonadetes bacterium]|nr:hypothetical protein [Armatimonadota bacterium]
MDVVDRLWDRLCQGRSVWFWSKRAVLASATPDRLARLLDAITGLPQLYRRFVAARSLRWLAGLGCTDLLNQPPLLTALVDALDVRHIGEDWWQNQDTWIYSIFLTLRAVVADLGPHAEPALRQLLGGPPRPLTLVTANGIDTPLGAKLAALELLDGSLTVADDALLGALVTNPDEPDEVRDEAARCWLRLCGPSQSAALAEYLLTRPSDLLRRWRDALPEAALAALVPHFVAALHGDTPELRMRARGLLVAVGQPATDALAAEVRAAETWQARQNAEEALGHIDRHALRAALSLREADGRSLSPAEPGGADAERGLSRSDGQERGG